jgi:hypothetical protein
MRHDTVAHAKEIHERTSQIQKRQASEAPESYWRIKRNEVVEELPEAVADRGFSEHPGNVLGEFESGS